MLLAIPDKGVLTFSTDTLMSDFKVIAAAVMGNVYKAIETEVTSVFATLGAVPHVSGESGDPFDLAENGDMPMENVATKV